MGENILGCFEFLGKFDAVKDTGNVVELGGSGQGLEDEVVCVRGWVAVVRGEGVDESGENMVGCLMVAFFFFFSGSCSC